MDINSSRVSKIAHMTSVHPVFDTRIFHKECLGLVKDNFEVILIVPHDKCECVGGVNIIGVTPGRKRFSRMMKTTFEVFSRAMKEKADLYHIHDPELLFYGQIMRLAGRRVVFDMHENLPKAVLTKRWLKPVYRPLVAYFVRLTERFFLSGLPVIFAETSYRGDYPWVECQAVVLNMPEAGYLPHVNENKYVVPTVAYVGAVTPERGSIATFQALEMLNKKGLEIDFECIGPVRGESQQAYLADMDSSTAKGIRLLGYLPPPVAWKRVSKCHIGLAILHPLPNYLESYPTKMFEYMAMGLPVVVSDFPLYRGVIEKHGCGICVDPKSPTAIAAAIEELILNPERACEMGNCGKRAVLEEFNWQHEAKKMHSIYEQILTT